MFVGHVAVGLAAKKVIPKTSVGISIMAGLFLDLLWPIFTLLGMENAGVKHSLGTINSLNLIHVPWSHGLVMSSFWSLLFGLICGIYYKSKKAGVILALAVFSHWILDFITHVPDLPFWMGEPKFGLGLWKSAILTLIVEGSLFIGCIYLYIKADPRFSTKRIIIFGSFITFLTIIYLATMFGKDPPESTTALQLTIPAFAMWIIVIWGHFSDQRN